MELETRFLFLVMVVIVECKTGEGSGHILLRKKYFNKKKLLSLLRSPYRRDPWGGSDTNLLFLLWGNLAGSHLQKGFQEKYSSRQLYVGLFPSKGPSVRSMSWSILQFVPQKFIFTTVLSQYLCLEHFWHMASVLWTIETPLVLRISKTSNFLQPIGSALPSPFTNIVHFTPTSIDTFYFTAMSCFGLSFVKISLFLHQLRRDVRLTPWLTQ